MGSSAILFAEKEARSRERKRERCAVICAKKFPRSIFASNIFKSLFV
jgi:hypothetical protein